MLRTETSRVSHRNPRRVDLLHRGGHMVLKEPFHRSAGGEKTICSCHPARHDEFYAQWTRYSR